MVFDAINGSFEAFSSLMILNNCRILHRHKMVRGVSILSAGFFLGWGFWNMIWYPSLHQPLSFMGGILITGANLAWTGMMIYYRAREKKTEGD